MLILKVGGDVVCGVLVGLDSAGSTSGAVRQLGFGRLNQRGVAEGQGCLDEAGVGHGLGVVSARILGKDVVGAATGAPEGG